MSQPLKGTPRSRGEEPGCPICGMPVGTVNQTAALHVVYRETLIEVAHRAILEGHETSMADISPAQIVDEYLAEREG